MIVWMYPGQPLAYSEKLPDDAEASAITELVFKSTGFNLEKFRWSGKEEDLQTSLQVYGCGMSLYKTALLKNSSHSPAMIAEHSMGIYPALAACGSIDAGDAVELTWRIGRELSKMSEKIEYAFTCVVGLTLSHIASLVENNGVYIANYNASRHFLLAGEAGKIKGAITEALAMGAFSVKEFPADAPIHTPLIEEITGALQAIIASYSFKEPIIPMMEHYSQSYLKKKAIPDFLLKELCLPVQWEATYLALRKAGITSWQEVGAGDSLMKYNRWIAGEQR